MQVGKTAFVFKKGDITKEQVGAIVNATTEKLQGGGAIDAAINKAGGPSIAAELKQLIAKIKQCPTGEAILTGAGKLKAEHLIHAVPPVWHGGKKNEAEDLSDAYYNSLVMAKEYGVTTIAFPALGVCAGYPADQAAKVALETCKSYCQEKECFEQIRFLFASDEELAAFESVAKELLA
jgi:O-acetyl-ADP-ribose deacetylase (regulator of RNase III)